MFELAYHSTEKRNKTNHIDCTDIVELNISAREISQDERSPDKMTSNDTVNVSTIANLMQKQCKATLYTNCLLKQLLQPINPTVQPASLKDVVEMENKLNGLAFNEKSLKTM
ncbi:unnamed protein product [Macrosiphum euphorbiae]|uniref:Uncharacterized protein n=1 Tax=Macrosiphum euphorbiae TaxID=13131 RepID=A0AAV0WBW2_9HEMI|nr:unnamed protein product [Macrosiphum euphorbiae]